MIGILLLVIQVIYTDNKKSNRYICAAGIDKKSRFSFPHQTHGDKNLVLAAIINGGVGGLLSYAEKHGAMIDLSKLYSSCWDACNAIAECVSSK